MNPTSNVRKLWSEKYCGASITVARSGTKMKYTHEIIDVSKAGTSSPTGAESAYLESRKFDRDDMY